MDTQDSKGKFSNTGMMNSLKDLRKKKSDFGLCKFELDKTIIGKIDKRQSHHIRFENSPPR